jgi:hypothetical protein
MLSPTPYSPNKVAPTDPYEPVDPIDPTNCPTCRSGFQPVEPPYEEAIGADY